MRYDNLFKALTDVCNFTALETDMIEIVAAVEKDLKTKVESLVDCPYCDGNGWTAEHAIHPHPNGDCLGMCPVQVQCHYCEATGKVSQEILDKLTKINKTQKL